MTANQINFAKYLEDVRTHKANEEIASRQAASAELQAIVAERNAATNEMNAETNALNAATNQSAVGAQWYGAQANAAYQQAMASVSQAQQLEAVRHNKTAEANDLIKSGRETTAKNYATQKQYESSVYATDTHKTEVEMQTRASLVNTLISAAPQVVSTVAKLLIGG